MLSSRWRGATPTTTNSSGNRRGASEAAPANDRHYALWTLGRWATPYIALVRTLPAVAAKIAEKHNVMEAEVHEAFEMTRLPTPLSDNRITSHVGAFSTLQ